MVERPKTPFFALSLGPEPRGIPAQTPNPAKKEATSPIPDTNEYEALVNALTPEERAQLVRLTPFIQGLLSHLREKYKSPAFAGVRVDLDTIRFDLPEKRVHDAVLSILTRVVAEEYKLAINSHNAGIPVPARIRPDLNKMN